MWCGPGCWRPEVRELPVAFAAGGEVVAAVLLGGVPAGAVAHTVRRGRRHPIYRQRISIRPSEKSALALKVTVVRDGPGWKISQLQDA